MKKETQIKCPNCGTSIDVQDILSHQLEEEIKHKYQSRIAAEKQKYQANTLVKLAQLCIASVILNYLIGNCNFRSFRYLLKK